MKLELSRQIFEKSSNIKFNENSSINEPSCSMETERQSVGRADMTKVIVVFRNFANAS
jgi:hypothetical protein